MWGWIAVVAAICLGVLLSELVGRSGHYGPAGVVDGQLTKGCGPAGCTDSRAVAVLLAKDVWCEWRGAGVAVHVQLEEMGGLRDGIKTWVVPRFETGKPGAERTSLGPARAVELGWIPAGDVYPPKNVIEKSGAATLDAGSPAGVRTGTPISRCEPCLVDAEFENPRGAQRTSPVPDRCFGKA
ncbi:MAG TPA: hypothetical protein VMG74_09790 [Gaiellaceae bacterium]|nr:hypothetical protein [Gaiellaceae bacterium]